MELFIVTYIYVLRAQSWQRMPDLHSVIFLVKPRNTKYGKAYKFSKMCGKIVP